MLEDLFSVVKVRFNGDKADDDKKKTDIPKGLLSSVQDAETSLLWRSFRQTARFVLTVTIIQDLPQKNVLISP